MARQRPKYSTEKKLEVIKRLEQEVEELKVLRNSYERGIKRTKATLMICRKLAQARHLRLSMLPTEISTHDVLRAKRQRFEAFKKRKLAMIEHLESLGHMEKARSIRELLYYSTLRYKYE